MKDQNHTDDKRTLLFIGNRWVNTIYNGYGLVKQRILLEILQAFQDNIKKTMRGHRIDIPGHVPYVGVELDMSRIVHYNNYFEVRRAIKEMTECPVQIYADPTFKAPIYQEAPLLCGFEPGKERKILRLHIKRSIAELLMHVDFNRNKNKAYQYTSFDLQTITRASSKYMYPLYTMICSYAEKGGFTIGIDELRQRLQVEEKYAGFDNFHRFILKHVQKELQIFGAHGFNFTLVKEGRTVKKIVFKIFANKKYDPNHVWLRIRRALTEELPYFARFTEEQREAFNYLLTGKYDLDKVLAKLQHIHKHLVRRRDSGVQVRDTWMYTLKSIEDQFPPG